MTAHFLQIVPLDATLIPSIECQRIACEYLADLLPDRSGRPGIEGIFPSVGDIDFNEHPEEALANPHYTDQTRFSITIDNHHHQLTDQELSELESLLSCPLKQKVVEY